jgi:hypothetical protein
MVVGDSVVGVRVGVGVNISLTCNLAGKLKPLKRNLPLHLHCDNVHSSWLLLDFTQEGHGCIDVKISRINNRI